MRAELCHEAIRLGLLLARHPATRLPRTHALLALMLLNAARLPARTDDAGNLLLLREQDRAKWNRAMIQRGIHYLGLAGTGDTLGEYHLEAGIAACHSTAADDSATDWARILRLYDQLLALKPSPVTVLNHAVAVARVHGPAAGLAALDELTARHRLDGYHLLPAVRGTFFAELDRFAEAVEQFQRAHDLAVLPSERDFLSRRIGECRRPSATA